MKYENGWYLCYVKHNQKEFPDVRYFLNDVSYLCNPAEITPYEDWMCLGIDLEDTPICRGPISQYIRVQSIDEAIILMSY